MKDQNRTQDSDEAAAPPLRSAGAAIFGLALLALTAGCQAELGGEVVFSDPDVAADLEVTWTIDGSDAPELCFEMGISEWLVTVNGPEVGEVSLACEDAWTSGNAFYGLLEGSYEVAVSAFDDLGYEIATQVSPVDLFDDLRGVYVLDFEFFSGDFF